MHVHSVWVSYTRSKQPKEYESAEPSVRFAAELDLGEDHVAVARRLMIDATGTVYSALGLSTPKGVADKLAVGEVPQGGSVTTLKSEGDKETRDPPKKSSSAPAAVAPVQRKKDAKSAEKARPADPIGDIPDDDDPGTLDDIPSDDDEASAEEQPAFTAADLQGMFTRLMKAKKVSGARLKELLAAHGANRTSDLAPASVLQIKKTLEDETA